MPNTLAHAGVQGLASRSLWPRADLVWIYLGFIIPDVPWILQRVVRVLVPWVDLYALRSYTIVQSSLLGCFLLCTAVALFTRASWRILGILGINTFLHLLLDALQKKWANGVHLWAPFSWELTNFGLFWPESTITYGLTCLGLIYIVWHWKSSVQESLNLAAVTPARIMVVGAFLAFYFAGPFLFIEQPVRHDNHFIRTLKSSHGRVGASIELDRVSYVRGAKGNYLAVWNGDRLRVKGLDVEPPAVVSIRGVFTERSEIRVEEYHRHISWFRNNASYLGLALILGVWFIRIRRELLED